MIPFTFVVSALLWLCVSPEAGLLAWCIGVSVLHALAEAQGKLWEYFGRVYKNSLVGDLEFFGPPFIVAPALIAQIVAAWMAFGGAEVNGWWLSTLIGLRAGDSLISHLIPLERGHGISPGTGTALIYALDSGLLAWMCWHKLSVTGAALGAGVFVSVAAGLYLTRDRD